MPSRSNTQQLEGRERREDYGILSENHELPHVSKSSHSTIASRLESPGRVTMTYHDNGTASNLDSDRASLSSPDGGNWYTSEEEQSIVRLLDQRLTLLLAIMYLLSFTDRSSMIRWSQHYLLGANSPRYRQCSSRRYVDTSRTYRIGF